MLAVVALTPTGQCIPQVQQLKQPFQAVPKAILGTSADCEVKQEMFWTQQRNWILL